MASFDETKLDSGIIASLYLEHAAELRSFLLGVLRDADLAGEVLQVTFTRAVESGHTVREESLKAWLFRVAYNEALAIRRKQSIRDRASHKLAAAYEDHAEELPEASLARFETVQQVRAALERLPAEQREVVMLRIYEGKKFAVIARELGLPLGTVLTRMRAALAKLRQSLGE